ncbi:MAG: glycoside hydrolase family 127 protein [Rikenellaceae bacterium]|nr:glycoside hydrolase family 127 protein [Rikenellaceae bacterium]
MIRKLFLGFTFCALCLSSFAQQKSLVNTSESPFAKAYGVNIEDVSWTDGFWAERFDVYKDDMIMGVWKTMDNPETAHAHRNFEIASGKVEGDWNEGPPFFDGDFYKWFESVATVYAITKDPKLEALMDEIIPEIAGSQREDGYIHTPAIIEERKTGQPAEFKDRLHFETYNLGHLITVGCVHYRATGKRDLLEVAINAADYLLDFYERSSPELARNAICPSHYMAVVEIYRTTRDPKYLHLGEQLINIRGLMENGTDDNQDRVPFRQQMKAMGHAVRANYLYAGVADVVAETGEDSLMNCLLSIWDDVVNTKMYITGACGALYDGTSPDGTCYEPDSIQKVHQAYGRSFQLPNITAHNESCANIGNLLWNWRMFNLTGQAKYIDIVEQVTYNSLLASISLDGKRFFYTNPLSANEDFPYTLRWSDQREEWIWVYCCPPNIARTLTQVGAYFYSYAPDGLYVNLYGGNNLNTQLNGKKLKLTQVSGYPHDGNTVITIDKAPKESFAIYLRIPGWCDDNVTLKVNGQIVEGTTPSSYARVERLWKKGDRIELEMPMRVKLIQANPLVEEVRNQAAVQYGPVIYCIEDKDIPHQYRLSDIKLPLSGHNLKPKIMSLEGLHILTLEGTGLAFEEDSWKGTLYREVQDANGNPVPIKLIPYYAWGNRGRADMDVWIPITR